MLYIRIVNHCNFIDRYLTWNFGFWEKRGIPGPKPYPLVGTMMDVFKKVIQHNVKYFELRGILVKRKK